MAKVYHVYGLICPRDHNVFYVGMTINPKKRMLEHILDPASSAYPYCQELKDQGLRPYMVYFYRTDDKLEARKLEASMAHLIPSLVNKYKSIPLMLRD